MAGCATALRPLYDLMKSQVLLSKVIHTDDTPVDVLDKNRNQTRTGRFWDYLGDREHPHTMFDYTPSRRPRPVRGRPRTARHQSTSSGRNGLVRSQLSIGRWTTRGGGGGGGG